MSKMSGVTKLALVIGGYVMACLVAVGAVYVNGLFIDPAVVQASSGMSAFGDLLLFVGGFCVLALFPTSVMLYFLVRTFMTRQRSGDS